MITPSPGYQITTNGACYVDMVDRYWLHTGNHEIVREFYPSIKKNTIFTMSLRQGPEGIISVPRGNVNPFSVGHVAPGFGLEMFEGLKTLGMSVHVCGIHLAQVKMAQRMAEQVGDEEFVRQCQTWFDQGSKLMEENLWNGKCYLTFYDPETRQKSAMVLTAQLDGEWMGRYHGLPHIFPFGRAKNTLRTVLRTNVPRQQYAPIGEITFWMTLCYFGRRDEALELARRSVHNIVIRHRYTWTQPNAIRSDTGERTYGSDYYQNMILWALPAALANKDIRGTCEPGGLVSKVLTCGNRVLTPSREL
jgi:uncharacterized protein (DUF608 family)